MRTFLFSKDNLQAALQVAPQPSGRLVLPLRSAKRGACRLAPDKIGKEERLALATPPPFPASCPFSLCPQNSGRRLHACLQVSQMVQRLTRSSAHKYILLYQGHLDEEILTSQGCLSNGSISGMAIPGWKVTRTKQSAQGSRSLRC